MKNLAGMTIALVFFIGLAACGGGGSSLSGSDTVGTYSISGTITTNGNALSGVSVTLSGSDSGTTTTDLNGFYSFSGARIGTFSISPSKTAYTFSPTSHTITVSGANVTGQSFTATAIPPNTNPGAPSGPAYVAACPVDTATPLFDVSPINPTDFIAFRPLGFMSTPIHMFPAKHSAFSMTLPGETAVPKPVRSPGKLTVTEIWEASFSTGGKNYQIYLYPCREVRVYFGHLSTLSDKLKGEFDKGAPKCNSFNEGTATVTTCRREGLNLAVESGEVIGSGPDTAGVDFGTLDARRNPAAFINLAHYDSYYPYWVSPLEFFAPSVRSAIEAKTGNVFGTRMRTAPPIGGTFMQDLAGKAQGNWFVPGKYHSNSTDLSPMVGLAHDYVDPTQPLMSAGSSILGMKMGLYSYTALSSGLVNRDFADIASDGNIYCIDSFIQGQSAGGLPVSKPGGALLITLPTPTTLKIERISATSCGSPAFWTFSSAATNLER
jgi:hypothetical protein